MGERYKRKATRGRWKRTKTDGELMRENINHILGRHYGRKRPKD